MGRSGPRGRDPVGLNPADFPPAAGVLDNAPATAGRYIAHVAVPCRDLDEAARWYSEVLGARPVRILKDRVTFSFGGVLQLVCHLERRAIEPNPRAYPRHHGLTFLRMQDYERIRQHLESKGAQFLVRSALRFPNTPSEHHTMMLVDPSGNVVEFKCYLDPEQSY
jgi:extradiol dioxygenase family protein